MDSSKPRSDSFCPDDGDPRPIGDGDPQENLERALGLFLPGHRIGPYRIISELGHGGYGTVFLARRASPEQNVAIKLLHHGHDTKDVRSRFSMEGEALARMRHANIATVHEVGETSGRPYVVMEYIEGQYITDFCKNNDSGLDERLSLFVQVCRAISHAHQNEFIHRDIKPSNILVEIIDGDPVVKVIDFGVAKAVGTVFSEIMQTMEDSVLGTIPYIAPEQARVIDRKVSTSSDVYSLGALLFELLTGVPPLDLKSHSLDALNALKNTIPDTASKRALPGLLVPADLDAIVANCLRKDPEERYGSVRELIADIDRLREGKPVTVVPPSVLYRARKFVSRHKAAVASATIVGVLLLASVATISVLVADRLQAVARDRLERADELARQARHLAELSPRESRDKLDEALRLAPDNRSVRTERAYQLVRAGDLDRARTVLDALIDEFADAEHVALRAALDAKGAGDVRPPSGLAPDRWYFARAMTEDDPAARIRLLDSAINARDWSFDFYSLRFRLLLAEGQFTAALSDAETLARNRSDVDSAHLFRGVALAYLGLDARKDGGDGSAEHEDALEAMNVAIELNPDGVYARFNRAWILSHLEREMEALPDAELLAAHESSKTDAATADIVGRIFVARGDMQRAREFFVISLGLDGSQDATWEMLSQAEVALGEIESAFESISKAIEIDGDSISYRSRRADLSIFYDREDLFSQDCAAFERLGRADLAKAMQSKNARVRGDVGRAKTLAEEAIALNENEVAWYVELAMSEWQLGRLDRATQIWQFLSGAGVEWALLSEWEVHLSRNDEVAAARVLDKAASVSDQLVASVAAYLQDQAPDNRALLEKRLWSRDERVTLEYYVGMEALVRRDHDRAAAAFQRVLDLGQIGFTEYEMANRRLKTIPRR